MEKTKMMEHDNTVHVTVRGRVERGNTKAALEALAVRIGVAGQPPEYDQVAIAKVTDIGLFETDFRLPAHLFQEGLVEAIFGSELPDLVFAVADPERRILYEVRERGRWTVDQETHHYTVQLILLNEHAVGQPPENVAPRNGQPNWANKVDNIEKLLTNFVVFTPTANDIGADGGATRAITAAGGASSSDELITRAFELVLGTSTPEADAAQAVNALNTAFKVEGQNGSRVVKWTPPSVLISTQTSEKLGGAQLVAYNFFKTIGDEAIKLLSTLKPLIPDADPERAVALREMMTTQLKRLVEEMGRLDGPRVARMEGLLQFLHSQLEAARDIYGYEPENARILPEEATLMTYKAAEQHLKSLRSAWDNYVSDRDSYLSTENNKLFIAFDAAFGSAWELEAALDSVWLDANERRALEIYVNEVNDVARSIIANTQRRMTIAALIEWIVDFARNEGKSLARIGGKDAMQEIARQASLLADYVETARLIDNDPNSNFTHPRVTNKRDALADTLDQIAALAAPLGAPPAPLSKSELDFIAKTFGLPGAPAGNGRR
jgi:hypothetical protein